jgi:hypothetical protein
MTSTSSNINRWRAFALLSDAVAKTTIREPRPVLAGAN